MTFLNRYKRILALIVALISIFSICGCQAVDTDYGTGSDNSDLNKKNDSVKVGKEAKIMSLDRVMSDYIDISLFDEENYADIYLGSDFEIEAHINENIFEVPCKLNDLADKGWVLADNNTHDKNSTIFAQEAVDLVFTDNEGNKITAQFYNTKKSSVKLSECNIVKFTLKNGFYKNPKKYISFNINGITNSMAITDIIDTLGTPSHFYPVTETEYYLDYFISKRDRRNGITVFVSTVDDCITKIEFSYYK